MKKNLNERWVITGAQMEDLDSLHKLATNYPLMNLPSDLGLLKEKILTSLDSFAGTLAVEKRIYLFLLKTKAGEVIGSSQLATQLGTKEEPSYSLKIFTNEQAEDYLQLQTETKGPSYLGGLVLDKKYRGHPSKGGKQISLIRFLFVSMYPHLFRSIFRAEVAPFLDANGLNPFFEHFVHDRVQLSMEEIDWLTLTNKQKLFALYPREKIPITSFPKEVKESLGKAGFFSQRAAGLLKKQNFKVGNQVDPFDGGPYIEAQKTEIPFITNARQVVVKKSKWEKKQQGGLKLFGKMQALQFEGGLLKQAYLDKNELVVSKEDLDFFNLKPHDSLFISEI